MQAVKQLITGSPEWHAERKLGIGGSDAAAAIGASRWKSPYQLYLEKIGEAEPTVETWEMSRGTALEPLIRQQYADQTGRVVKLPTGPIISTKHPFMRYNPDGMTEDMRVVEIKTATNGAGWGEPGSDEIPAEYTIQVQHGMICLGFAVADVVVSIGGARPVLYEVPADKELQQLIIEEEARFWEKVQSRTEPAPITSEDVAKRFSRSRGTPIAADAAILAALSDLRTVRQQIDALTDDKEKIEVRIKNFMGENDTLTDEAGKVLATWKQAKAAERLDSKQLRADYPDVAAQYTIIGEPVRRFLLK